MRDHMLSRRRANAPRARVAIAVMLLAASGLVTHTANAAGPLVIKIAPSGGDDTQRLQNALDAATAAGRGTVIELKAGTFRIARPLIGVNIDATIRGAGPRKTTVVADGSLNPDGLFQSTPAAEAAALRTLTFPTLFSFAESDVDRFGQPVTRRSQRIAMQDLTLAARGRTVPHYEINENTDTQRLFAHVWIVGYRADWTNTQGQHPGNLGYIDAEQARLSTVRVSLQRVHFDGRNRARADNEPGGAFDPNPDVRNAFGLEGGFALLKGPPDPIFFFKPFNAALTVDNSSFTDLPGQSGIFAPQIVGRNDPAWTFGPDAVAGSVKVTNSVFENIAFDGVAVGDISDVDVTVAGSQFRHTGFGVDLWTNYEWTYGAEIGYPPPVASTATILGSTFDDAGPAAIWMDEADGPSLVDLVVRGNDFVLAAPSHAGVVGFVTDDAQIVGNDFSGEGYAAVVALRSSDWTVRGNNFCDLAIPASAPSDIGLPANDAQAPVVILDSVNIRTRSNTCQ